jgi:putative ABC transport system ATP-binding protein
MQLSGGEKQRVAVGRALIKNPTFCFADEPTSALDWSRGELVVELLRNAARDHGRTVLVVSHDVRMIDYVDRVFSMEDGKLLGQPSTRETAPGVWLDDKSEQRHLPAGGQSPSSAERGSKFPGEMP